MFRPRQPPKGTLGIQGRTNGTNPESLLGSYFWDGGSMRFVDGASCADEPAGGADLAGTRQPRLSDGLPVGLRRVLGRAFERHGDPDLDHLRQLDLAAARRSQG